MSLAVGAERKRGAEQQDALQLAAQLGARTQGGGSGGGGEGARNGSGGGEGSTDKDKKLKNLRKVSKQFFGGEEERKERGRGTGGRGREGEGGGEFQNLSGMTSTLY